MDAHLGPPRPGVPGQPCSWSAAPECQQCPAEQLTWQEYDPSCPGHPGELPGIEGSSPCLYGVREEITVSQSFCLVIDGLDDRNASSLKGFNPKKTSTV